MMSNVEPTADTTQPCYRVPRRFGMGAIMIGMTLFSLLVAFLSAAGVPGFLIAAVVGFFITVAFAQVFLFGGRRPRLVSILVGIVTMIAIGEIYMVIQINRFVGWNWNWFALSQVLQMGAYAAMWGALFGYVAGGVLAGIFLVLVYIESWLTGKPRQVTGRMTESRSALSEGEFFLPERPALAPEAPGYRVPKRFGMGAIAIGMTLFSFLVAGLVKYGVPGEQIAGAVAYFIVVAFAQMFLYGGNRPRKASVVGGAIAGGVLMAVLGVFEILTRTNTFPPPVKIFLVATYALSGAVVGAIAGYPAGSFLAGIFLLLDYTESWLTGKPRHVPGEEQAPAAPSAE